MSRPALLAATGLVTNPLDCIVIGGGPAGLTAALYLARYRRQVMVIDGGASRAKLIPKTHNVTGYDDGIIGRELIARMTRHAARFGTLFRDSEVCRLRRGAGVFLVDTKEASLAARTVLLATGVSDHPPFPGVLDHEAATLAGSLRYCPVCDGFEAIGKRVAVLGQDSHGAAEALFLRTYVSDLTLLPVRALQLSANQLKTLDQAGVCVIEQPVISIEAGDGVCMTLNGGNQLFFHMLYAALGSTPHSQLARALGAGITQNGCVATDDQMETTISGLFAAGDVVEGLDQISVAVGQAAIAATAIHHRLPFVRAPVHR